jgi:hypothetical protein
MQPADVRRWALARRAADARERAEARADPTPRDAAISGALALVALAGRLHGWPVPVDDPDTRREDLLGYARWSKLRAVLGRP